MTLSSSTGCFVFAAADASNLALGTREIGPPRHAWLLERDQALVLQAYTSSPDSFAGTGSSPKAPPWRPGPIADARVFRYELGKAPAPEFLGGELKGEIVGGEIVGA